MLRMIAALRELANRESELANSFRLAGRFEIAARHEARRGAFLEAIQIANRLSVEHGDRAREED
jgi:hypothetical protein